MTHSGTRSRSLLGYGLLAMALFWAYGKAVASPKSKPSAAQLVPTIQMPSTPPDTFSDPSGTFDAETLRAARRAVHRRSADLDEEFLVLDQLGLL
jgi:hypothetical protein